MDFDGKPSWAYTAPDPRFTPLHGLESGWLSFLSHSISIAPITPDICVAGSGSGHYQLPEIPVLEQLPYRDGYRLQITSRVLNSALKASELMHPSGMSNYDLACNLPKSSESLPGWAAFRAFPTSGIVSLQLAPGGCESSLSFRGLRRFEYSDLSRSPA